MECYIPAAKEDSHRWLITFKLKSGRMPFRRHTMLSIESWKHHAASMMEGSYCFLEHHNPSTARSVYALQAY